MILKKKLTQLIHLIFLLVLQQPSLQRKLMQTKTTSAQLSLLLRRYLLQLWSLWLEFCFLDVCMLKKYTQGTTYKAIYLFMHINYHFFCIFINTSISFNLLN